jgi:hypothetical protein
MSSTCPSIALALAISAAVPQESEPLEPPLRTERFELGSNTAAETEARTGGDAPERPVPEAEMDELDPAIWEPFEVRAWEQAVADYREHVIGRDLLFDEGPVSLERTYSWEPGFKPRSPEDPNAKERELILTMARTWSVYEHTWWPDRERANRAWNAAVGPLLAEHEVELSERVAAALGGEWPGRVRVDVSAYPNRAGVDTTANPVHVTIASGAAEYRGWSALEILVHEPCHASAIERPLSAALDAAFAPAAPPRDLGHATLFFTSGELTRRVAAAHGAPDHERLGDRIRVYTRAFKAEREVLGRHGVHGLDGAAAREEVLAEMALDLAGGR